VRISWLEKEKARPGGRAEAKHNEQAVTVSAKHAQLAPAVMTVVAMRVVVPG
jgi:hypothetical protein